MPERARRRKAKIKWTMVILVGVAFLASGSVASYLALHARREEEFQKSVIVNCEKNGNPLREVLQHRIQREIKQSENQHLLEKILPNTDPKELKKFAELSIKVLTEEEMEIEPVNCQKKYQH